MAMAMATNNLEATTSSIDRLDKDMRGMEQEVVQIDKRRVEMIETMEAEKERDIGMLAVQATNLEALEIR
jgi:hypothetical protein